MLQAIDLIIENPLILDENASGREAVDLLVGAESGLVCTASGGSIKGLITARSLLDFSGGGRDPGQCTAADLAIKPTPSLSAGQHWPAVVPLLLKWGAAAVVSGDGSIIGVITLCGALTMLAAKAEEFERELDAIIDFSSDEILVADNEGRVLRANAVFEENFGVKLSRVLGKTVEELEEKKIFFPSVTKLVLDKKSVQTVIQSRRDGRKLLATGTPAFNSDGSIFRVIVNTRDITRLNKLKQQLDEAELLKNRYQQELVELRQGYLTGSVIIASSPAMLELIKVARRIAAADSTVLLTGESGTGKGMIARYIHNASPRSEKPFSVVNCGAIPENLLESELFGYAGGAFTGARREGKIGKLELANEGTIFLDEIAELPLSLQVKLLHVLQEGVISRVGGTAETRLNLRFIAATNRDLAARVREGRFREDLYFRLDVIPLHVPPLRERREDIKPLSEQFMEKLSRRYGGQKYFSEEAYAYLDKYHWPGNVRELENLIERMMIVVEGNEIGLKHLPRHLVGRGYRESSVLPPVAIFKPLQEAREDLERFLFGEALRRYRTTYEIARVLEVDQSTVVRKLKKYGLGPPGDDGSGMA